MPIRGENIGTAYVRIVGDGSGLPDDVRDAFDDSEPSVREGARSHGKTYDQEFAKSMRKNYRGTFGRSFRDIVNDLNKNMTQGMAKLEFADRFFKNQSWVAFKKRLEAEGGAAGRLLARELEQEFRDSGDLNGLTRTMENYGKRMRAAQQKILAELNALDVERVKGNMALLNREVAQFLANDRNAMDKGELVDLLRETRKAANDAGLATNLLTETLNDHERSLRHHRPWLDRWNTSMTKLSDGIGTAFGRGSRNNFLNFIGSMARNITLVVTGAIPRLLQGVLSLKDTFLDAGGGIRGFGAVLGALGPVIGTVVAALAALLFVVGPLVSALSLLLGAIIAIASTLTMGLIGALGAVAGAMLPFAAGIGVAITAFANLDDASRKAAGAIGDAFKDLGDSAAAGLTWDRMPWAEKHNHEIRTFAEQMNVIKNAVSDMDRLFRNLGRTVGDVIDIFLDTVVASNVWSDFLDRIDGGQEDIGWMARRFRELGRAFSNFFAGGLGFFEALMPTIARFTGWIRDIAVDFNNFANSARGQAAIARFFDDAADSAAAFGSLLGGIWDWLGAVINLGNEAGDSMFRTLGDKFREWAAYLNTPQGSAAFRQWMSDAREFAENIGNLILLVGKLADILDNDWSRGTITALTGDLGDMRSIVLGSSGDASDAANSFLGLNGVFRSVAGTIRNSFVPSTEEAKAALQALTREEVLNTLQKRGLIEVGNRLGITTRDLIDASLGNRDAQKRVNDAMREGGGYAEDYLRPRIRRLQEHYAALKNTVEANRQNLATWAEALRGVPKDAQTEIKTLGFRPSLKQINDIRREYDLTPKQLKIAMQAVGYQPTRRQIRILTTDIKGIPKRIETRIENKGIPKTMAQLDKLFDKQNATRREIRSTVKALGVEKAWGEFRRVQIEADKTGKKVASPKVLVTDEQFKRGMVDANRSLSEFGRAHKTARIDVDPGNSTGVIDNVLGMLDRIRDKTITIHTNYISGGKPPPTASGGMFFGPQVRLIGEAGAEAVVPLNRNLSQVDPAVRWLSAIAQGKIPAMAGGGVVGGGGKTVNVEQHIYSPQSDARAVASETVNRLVAVGY